MGIVSGCHVNCSQELVILKKLKVLLAGKLNEESLIDKCCIFLALQYVHLYDNEVIISTNHTSALCTYGKAKKLQHLSIKVSSFNLAAG